MRLQVAVHRHDLPEVRLIYNTAPKHGPGISRITIVADLLSAINALVPLESADGEWGLEDYVVEVAATADQSQTYECFHFQEINDVLREDDEVVIRGLTNEELRQRRQGGRLQIARDGRHLIDGLSWGRRLKPGAHLVRPGFNIPPRKRRRIVMDSESEPEEEVRLELEYPPSWELGPPRNGEEAHADHDEDEDEDDEDYEDDGDEEEYDDEENEAEEELEPEPVESEEKTFWNQARQVLAKATFDNADSVSGDEDHDEQMDDDIDDELSEGAEDFTAELEALTADAGNNGIDLNQPRRTRGDSYFESFPAPLKRTQVTDTNGVNDSVVNSSQLFEEADITGNTDMFIFKAGSNGDTVTVAQAPNHETGGLPNEIGQDKINHVSTRNNEGSKHSVSSSDDESSEADSSDDSSSSDSGDSSSSDDDDESSDEDSDSGESSSSSDSSLSSVRPTTKSTSPPKLETPGEKPQDDGPPNDSKTLPRSNNPPGTGQNKTKRNNERKRLSKLLSNLKEAGKLEQDADFKTLREYLAGTNEGTEQENEVLENEREDEVQTSATQDKINARAQEVLSRLNKADDAATQPSQEASIAAPASSLPNDRIAKDVANLGALQDKSMTDANTTIPADPPTKSAADTTMTIVAEPTIVQQEPDKTSSKRTQPESDETSLKRVRLDVAASRRMLFNSLGVRNPKTAEAENALREKLSKPARQVKSREPETKERKIPPALPAADRWKNKFTVYAVECVQDWKKVEVPPFPFKQPWQVRQERTEMARTSRQHETYEEGLNYDDVEEDQDTQPMDIDREPEEERPSQSVTTSRTLTAGTTIEDDDLPEPSDFSVLPALTESDVSRATIVAYKELRMNARFEPEQSPYRVAKIVSYADNTLRLRLAPRYRRQANDAQDEETNEPQYNPFEVPRDEDDEPDDGIREVEFGQMIQPKIVTMSSEQDDQQDARPGNPGSKNTDGQPTLSGGHLDNAVQHLSQMLGNEVSVSTPRRAEINSMIKEAGFESAVDGQLLQGLSEAAAQDEPSLPVQDESMGDITATDALQPTSPVQGNADTSALRESSVPSESMVESVKYPQLSELEVDTPMPAQSSSHQDAQKAPPTPVLPVDDSTNLEITFQEPIDELDPKPDSLPSEVPQTQSQDFIPDSHTHKKPPTSRALSASPLPDIGPQHDGSSSPRPDHRIDPDDEPEDDDDESIDSNGFPSIRSLTSSQQVRRSANTNTTAQPSDKKTSVTKIRHSPPEPTRRSPRIRKTTARSSDWSDTDTTSQPISQVHAQPQPPVQPQVHAPTSFKASQSQPSRLSQIPDDTIFVDLTQSSPAPSPEGKGKEKEKDKESDKNLKPGAARKNAKDKDKDKGEGSGVSGTRGPSNIFRKSFEGLGEKSYLRKKKRSL